MVLYTLGGLRLEGSDFQRAKPLLLVTYLALEGSKERRFLAELFWPAMDTDLDNLTTTLARLRRVIPEYLDMNHLYARVTIPSDIQVLEKAFEAKDWEQVLALYKGPFLQGFSTDGLGMEVEEWIFQKREWMADKARMALLQMGKQEASVRRYDKAAQYASRAYEMAYASELEIEDFELLYALFKAGNHPMAKAIREEAKEFGLELQVGNTPQHLFTAKLTATTLPVQNTVFVGRETEKTQLAQHFEHYRLITLIGPGGIGKTRLALSFAQQCQQQFADGVWFVPLDIVTSPEQIVFAVADTLGIQLGGQNPQEQVFSYLRDKNMLIVLDNLEHLVDDVSFIANLLASSTGIKVLVTSREILGLQSEYLFEVQGLKLPQQMEVSEAVELFAERARQHRQDFNLEQHLPTVVTICNLLGGMPLAIELAASWLRILEIDELVSEVQTGLDVLSATVKDLPERHQNLQQVFEVSWKRLSQSQQEALQRLAVFQGGFNREAARDIAGIDLRMILQLINKSFLRRNDKGRFSQHPLIFYYLQQKAKAHVDVYQQMQERHSQFYLEKLRSSVGDLRTSKARVAREALELDLPNIRSAWNYSVEHAKAELVGYARALSQFLDSHHDHEAIALFEKAAEGFDERNPDHHTILGHLLIFRAKHGLNLGIDVVSLATTTQRALALLQPLNEFSGLIEGSFILGYIAREQGNFAGAIDIFDKALQMSRAQGTPQQIGQALAWLCSTKPNIDDASKVNAFMLEGIQELRLLGDLVNLCYGLFTYGSYLIQQGKLGQAEEMLREALEVEQASYFLAIPIQAELGRLAYVRKDFTDAEHLFKKAFDKAERIGDEFTKVNVLALLGRVKREQKQLDEAENILIMALEKSHSAKLLLASARVLLYIAELCLSSKPQYALTLLYFLQNYPSMLKRDKDELRRCVAEAEALFSKQERNKLAKEAKSLTIDEVLDSVFKQDPSKRFRFPSDD